MNLLWITRFPPYSPLRGGAYDYSRDLIGALARCATVRGLAFSTPEVTPPEDRVRWETMHHREPPRIASLASTLPNVAARNVDAALLDRAVALARDSDGVFVDFIAMAWLVAPLQARLKAAPGAPPVIMVSHNHEHAMRTQMARHARSPIMGAALALDAWKAGRLERTANAAADGLTTIIATDKEAFARECATPGLTLPPVYAGPVRAERTIDATTPRVAAVLGNRNATHKMMVLQRTLTAFAAAGLDRSAKIEIAGEGNYESLRGRYPAMDFRGYVPDLVAYLDRVRLGLLSDDIGGGFKIRAMSYAMLRVPMLALREAMAGMEFEEGVHFIGVDDLTEMAEAATSLIDDFDRLNALQEAAFAFASKRFDADVAGRRMTDFVTSLGTSQ